MIDSMDFAGTIRMPHSFENLVAGTGHKYKLTSDLWGGNGSIAKKKIIYKSWGLLHTT